MALTAWRVADAKYTVAPYDPFDGQGAKLFGGRWNSAGVAAVYATWSVSLAVLESLVHARKLDSLLGLRIASLTISEADVSDAPAWRGSPLPLAESRAIGDAWIAAKTTPVLRLPSVVIPQEFNYLMNPEHPEFPRIRATASKWGPLPIDRRLLETK
jgi:RES domain-containing protein